MRSSDVTKLSSSVACATLSITCTSTRAKSSTTGRRCGSARRASLRLSTVAATHAVTVLPRRLPMTVNRSPSSAKTACFTLGDLCFAALTSDCTTGTASSVSPAASLRSASSPAMEKEPRPVSEPAPVAAAAWAVVDGLTRQAVSRPRNRSRISRRTFSTRSLKRFTRRASPLSRALMSAGTASGRALITVSRQRLADLRTFHDESSSSSRSIMSSSSSTASSSPDASLPSPAVPAAARAPFAAAPLSGRPLSIVAKTSLMSADVTVAFTFRSAAPFAVARTLPRRFDAYAPDMAAGAETLASGSSSGTASAAVSGDPGSDCRLCWLAGDAVGTEPPAAEALPAASRAFFFDPADTSFSISYTRSTARPSPSTTAWHTSRAALANMAPIVA
mmetsp:Transcript_16625/g.51553  ORF Transcript_16625/g.51553 Transcript_16625/m.51553 type:complete len:391 (+) Transcript_16625:2317-3489(+)